MKNGFAKLLGVCMFGVLAMLSGCAGVNTFPAIARPGDTVSVMVGGSAQANKTNVGAVFTDAQGNVWDLRALGLVRSVFNLRTDGRAYGAHYSPYLDSYISWAFGHEPLQTVLVADLPAGAAVGQGTLSISMNVSDNSSGVASPFNVNLEIIAGTGSSDQLLRHSSSGNQPVDFSRLETGPNAKVTFGGSTFIGAASLTISFDSTVVNGNDLNIYVPEATVRRIGVAFGKNQRMVYWHQDGVKLYVDIVAPQGIDPKYLQLFVVHPRGLTGSPAFNIVSAQVYDVTGAAISMTPTLTYSP